MDARVVVYFFICELLIAASVRLNVIRDPFLIKSKSKIELSPLIISAGLNDIIIIAAPIIDKGAVYHLNAPNGEQIQLSINTDNIIAEYAKNLKNSIDEYNNIVVKHIKGELKAIITPLNRYKVFNVNYGRTCTDNSTFLEETKSMMPNDFVLGPLQEKDHGNWILSVYFKNKNKEWIELYQVITIEILDVIPALPKKPKLKPGDTFELSFAYPIKHLESCEITAPRSTFDRFFERSRMNMDSCAFKIPNITKADQGLWQLIGVGKIIYEATVYLEINDNIT